MTKWLGLFTGILCVAAAAAAGETTAVPSWIGYGGPNGSRVYADCRPPLEFDGVSGKNVRWVVPLPGWGHGSPIVTQGKDFLLCEPDPTHDFPYLVCLDAGNGRVLWTRDLDHLEQLIPDPKAREQTRADWRTLKAFTYLKYAFRHALATAADKEAVKRDYAAKGMDVASAGDGLALTDMTPVEAARKRLRAHGMTPEGWQDSLARGIDCVGQAYATPVSDGESVYATTAAGGHFCFDLSGKLRWSAAVSGDVPKGRGDDYCQNGRSPILYRDLLISTQSNLVRALDRATGKVRWTSDAPDRAGAHTIVTPVVFTSGGTDVLLTAGPCAFRLPDGKPLAIKGWRDEGMQFLVKPGEPDVVFFCGSGEHCGWTGKGNAEFQPPAAVRFALAGETLTAKVLWHGGDLGGPQKAGGGGKDLWGGNAPWMLSHDGKFYHRSGLILDALTGKVLAGAVERKGDRRAVPETRHLLAVAGDHVFGLSRSAGRLGGGGAVMEVFTLDGKKVAANQLPMPKLTPEQEEQAAKIGWSGSNDKGDWAKGYAFTFAGDRIYIRSMVHLYCIGPTPVAPTGGGR